MWPLVAVGVLASSFCIDLCTTLLIVVLTVMAVAVFRPASDPVYRSREGSSARRADTATEESVESAGESKKDEPTSSPREMTANRRRLVETSEPAATTHTPPPSYGAFVGMRSRDAQLRLMQTMKKEMVSARLHQFERPRITSTE